MPTQPVEASGIYTSRAYVDHLFPCVLMLLDFGFSNIPFIFAHTVLSVGYAFAYLVWTLIQFRLNLPSTYCHPGCIYPGFDWSDPATAFPISVSLLLVGAPALTSAVWFITNAVRAAADRHGGEPWISLDAGASKILVPPIPRPWYLACCASTDDWGEEDNDVDEPEPSV